MTGSEWWGKRDGVGLGKGQQCDIVAVPLSATEPLCLCVLGVIGIIVL